ncbi:MAG: class I SAM-dependent methyltransferase [Gammaproteobacteria bacterium]|nr:class I SAM-dependent methyltransferase [Gammaproteobacteria bacterium]
MTSESQKKQRNFFRRKRIRATDFEFDQSQSIKDDIARKYNFEGDLLDIFVNNTGMLVYKWHHYIPIYDRYFSKYRGTEVRFLEIGVSKGGSLRMWRKYLGKDAIIYGIDIDPDCARYNGIHGEVRIGSQTDPDFLASVIKEMGGVDVVLDDGSHKMEHIRTTLEKVLPKVTDEGIYMIEDLHTSYWPNYGGGHASKKNFFNLVRLLIDDIHHWYHNKGIRLPKVSSHCRSVHIYDSIVVFEKGEMIRPTNSQII